MYTLEALWRIPLRAIQSDDSLMLISAIPTLCAVNAQSHRRAPTTKIYTLHMLYKSAECFQLRMYLTTNFCTISINYSILVKIDFHLKESAKAEEDLFNYFNSVDKKKKNCCEPSI